MKRFTSIYRLSIGLALFAIVGGCATPGSWWTKESYTPPVTGPASAEIRGQDPGPAPAYPTPDQTFPQTPEGYSRGPLPVSGPVPGGSGLPPQPYQNYQQPAPRTAQQPFGPNTFPGGNVNVPGGSVPGGNSPYLPSTLPTPGGYPPPPSQYVTPEGLPQGVPALPPDTLGLPQNFADIEAYVEEARTGRLMFGVGVNSSAGVTGQIVVDERNFDITAVPESFQDFVNGTAFRGAGQGFRLEALPGTVVQRYLFSFTEPYLFNTQVSFGVSGFFYNRNFFDWDEERIGGRISLGYRLTPDLSISAAIRAEKINIFNPRVPVPELTQVLGDNYVYSPQLTLTHDTRDMPFAATEGHYIELTYGQVFGTFDYPRGDIDLRRYHLIMERPDGSGRHTFSYGFRFGFSGSQTPIYDNYTAGGYSTMRGFDFRGASPVNNGVVVGGEYRFLGTVEYTFPITADDSLKGVFFVDYGTVEEKIEINDENFRVAPGFGFRLTVPAMGPAPLAFDFAFPVLQADSDQEQIFSFFVGLGRL